MNQEEIINLGKLARIELSETEIETLTKEMSAILEYVSVVKDIVGEEAVIGSAVGPRHNVFRKDEVTNQPDEYTETILAEMPATERRFMVVKKILNTDS